VSYRRYPPKISFEEWVVVALLLALVAVGVYRLLS
jgi:hypothetical protein